MLKAIIPKLPMRNKGITLNYYTKQLGFEDVGKQDYESYLILQKDGFQIHFFEFPDLNPLENDGQIYLRTSHIDLLYHQLIERKTIIHPQGSLQIKAWGQKEFSLLDPDHNLLTFGESI